MELQDFDLNLLLVFHHLLRERRVSAVATSLGVSQPAVSNALKRLRRSLGDELFLRTARGMEPTPFAQELAEPIASALAAIHGSLNRRSSFDPATETRNFTVAMTDIGEIHFLPGLLDELARRAPNVTLTSFENTSSALRDELESGQVDLAIGFLPQLQAGFFRRQLFRQRYVCLFRAGHPRLDKDALTLEDFTEAEHLVVHATGTGHGRADELLERAGIRRKVRLYLPHFVGVGHLLEASDLIATVPEKLAIRSAVPFGLKYLPHPVVIPEIQINLFWHARYQREPGNQWLRQLISERFVE